MTQELIQTLNGHLYQLGWSWKHPKIQAYLKLVATRLKVLEFQRIEEVPEIYLKKLVRLIYLYIECEKLMQRLKLDWQSPDIQLIVSSYGYTDKMPLSGYEKLNEWLEYTWFDKYGF